MRVSEIKRSRILAVLAGALVLTADPEAQERTRSYVRVQGDRFDLDASGITLAELLTSLSRDARVAFTIRGDPSRVQVSDSFEDMNLRLGLQRVLSAHSHLLVDHRTAESIRHIELILLGAGAGTPPQFIQALAQSDASTIALDESPESLLAKVVSRAPAAERAAAADAVAYSIEPDESGGYGDQFLIQLLADPDESMRARAIESLKDTADSVPFPDLAQVAREDPSAAVRARALELIVERSENGEWREPLGIALSDYEAAVRERARELALDWHLDVHE